MSKEKARDKRLRQQEEKKQKIQSVNEKREAERLRKEQEEARAEKAKEEAREKAQFENEIAQIEREAPNSAKRKKSEAKAAGLKSTFVLAADKLMMSSFGNGNSAIREKYIEDGHISNISEIPVLDVKNDEDEKKFLISGRLVSNATADNPLKTKRPTGMDQIKCKDKLEKLYYGKCFDDNIHIQLIYNILDIEKILTVHVNNVVFELNNILRNEGNEFSDLIGEGLGREKTYADFVKSGAKKFDTFKKFAYCKQLGYFGGTLLIPRERDRKKVEDVDNVHLKRTYDLLSALSVLRQATAHGEASTRAQIFNFDSEKSKKSKYYLEIRTALDNLYEDRVHTLNERFLERAAKDLKIIFDIFSVESASEKQRVIEEYYDFVVLKSYKNTGFSIKHLRELIIQNYAGNIADHEYDSVRPRLNRMLDFIIFEYYAKTENQESASYLVDSLRAADRDSVKEALYRRAAGHIWKAIGNAVSDRLLPKMNGDYIGALSEVLVDDMSISSVAIPETAHVFTEMVYLLTIFLDGKEINDLLTQLVSKFEIIESLNAVLREEGLETGFCSDYTMFEKSGEISRQLRAVNSFARMSEEDPSVKMVLFVEAALILGYSGNREELECYVEELFNKDGGKRLTDGRKDNGFRNFIINNVITSDRFKYLVRYGNPEKIRKIANNRKVVEFVLKAIPDAQIRFYYNSCNGTNAAYESAMRDDLADKITGISFLDFENVHQNDKGYNAWHGDKERKKNIIRLYLTVLYLLMKNLVYVNSRYYLAFHCAERDAMIWDDKKYKFTNESKCADRVNFAKAWIEENSRDTRAKHYLIDNFKNADIWAISTFRNCAEHLNAVRNMDSYINDIAHFDSYFELYHYLVQRQLMKEFDYETTTPAKDNNNRMLLEADELTGKTEKYLDIVRKYNFYCKDFVKALNVPFAYNLARYKNLSIDALFDRNNYLGATKESIKSEE